MDELEYYGDLPPWHEDDIYEEALTYVESYNKLDTMTQCQNKLEKNHTYNKYARYKEYIQRYEEDGI